MFGLIVSFCFMCLFFLFYFIDKRYSNKKLYNNNFDSQNNVEATRNNLDEKNGFKIILNIGVFLIILSSIIFATTTWNTYDDNIKILILGIETLLFLLLGITLKEIFKVEKSGNALTFISSILLFATFLSAGYFKVFGNYFSLFGEYKYIFLSVAFLLEAIVLIIRKSLIRSNKYFIILSCFIIGVFLLMFGLINDFILSAAITSVILLIMNFFNKKIFKDMLEYNIFNYALIGILTLTYLSGAIHQLIFKDTFILQRFSLILLLASLVVNFVISIGRKNEVLNILSIVYEGFLMFWFVVFSGSLIASSLALVVSGLVLYLIYYLSKNKYLSFATLVISYLQGLLGIILICFDKTYVLLAPIISFSYIVLTFISSLKKDSTYVLNAIFEPIYLIMFAIGILIQPVIIDKVKPIDVVMVINICLIIALIIATLLKNNIKKGYFIILMIGLLIQIICSYYTDIIYSIITIIVNAVVVLYSFISKDEFYKKLNFPASLLFILSIIIGLEKYNLVAALLVLLSLLLFMHLNKDNKKRFVYMSLLFIPILEVISVTNLRLSLKHDLKLLVMIPFITLFSRKIINDKEENGMCVLELILFSMLSFNIHNDLFALLYLVILYVIAYLLSFKWETSSKVYLNYLLFITPFIFFTFDDGIYEALYMIFVISSLVINQVLYRILFYERKILFELFHFLISMVLIISLVGSLAFNNLLSAIIAVILIIILYLIYENKKMKYIVLSFVIYPLSLLIDYIPYQKVNNILNLFIWMIPITILLRRVFKVDKIASVAIESVTLSLMFLLFIFNVNVYVGVTLGVISVILIILGILLKYKSFSYVGYVSLILTIVIQTINLWGSIPWWVYLLVSGIALVIVAAVIESKKK